MPGVIQVFTHENRRRTAWFDSKFQDEVGPPGSPFRALYDRDIVYSGQPVALVVADDYETARYAASLVRIEYHVADHTTDLDAQRRRAYVPPKVRRASRPHPSRAATPMRHSMPRPSRSGRSTGSRLSITIPWRHMRRP